MLKIENVEIKEPLNLLELDFMQDNLILKEILMADEGWDLLKMLKKVKPEIKRKSQLIKFFLYTNPMDFASERVKAPIKYLLKLDIPVLETFDFENILNYFDDFGLVLRSGNLDKIKYKRFFDYFVDNKYKIFVCDKKYKKQIEIFTVTRSEKSNRYKFETLEEHYFF